MFFFGFGLEVSVPSLESCPPPPQASGLGPKWGDANSCGGGNGGAQFNEGTEALVLFVYYKYNPFTMCPYSTILLVKNSCTVRMKIIRPFVT
jgi:hypothetical protein